MDLDFIDISREQSRKPAQHRRPTQQTRSIQQTRRKPQEERDFSIIECNRPVNRRELQRKKKIRAKRRFFYKLRILCLLIVTAGLVILLVKLLTNGISKQEMIEAWNSERDKLLQTSEAVKPEITEDFLTINQYSRPGEAIGKVKNIFVHYTANPGTSASQNKSYFENLAASGETSASAHFVIGYEGEIVQCIPLNEIGYAVVNRNYDTISIECCYLSEDGKFTDATYQSLCKLSRWLLGKYRLKPQDMRRHYDEGGKMCPLYYVKHEDAWLQFIDDLEK